MCCTIFLRKNSSNQRSASAEEGKRGSVPQEEQVEGGEDAGEGDGEVKTRPDDGRLVEDACQTPFLTEQPGVQPRDALEVGARAEQ